MSGTAISFINGCDTTAIITHEMIFQMQKYTKNFLFDILFPLFLFGFVYNMPDLLATKKNCSIYDSPSLFAYFSTWFSLILNSPSTSRSSFLSDSASGLLPCGTLTNSARPFLFAFFQYFSQFCHLYQRSGKQIAGLEKFWYNIFMGKLKMQRRPAFSLTLMKKLTTGGGLIAFS